MNRTDDPRLERRALPAELIPSVFTFMENLGGSGWNSNQRPRLIKTVL